MMKIRKYELARAIDKAKGIVMKNNAFPALECILIDGQSAVASNTEITKATKDKNKLQKQLKETQEYDEALAHIANQNIEINLDDGVKVNYTKFQNVEVSREGKKTKKINLLKKL